MAVLLNKKELSLFKYKSKTKIKQKFSNKKTELRVEFLKVTSKKFKRLFDLTTKDNIIYIKDRYKYDILLYKAMQYVK